MTPQRLYAGLAIIGEVIQSELHSDVKPRFIGGPGPTKGEYMRSNEIEAKKKKLRLQTEQREVLVGLLLGDGHLETQNHGRTFRLKIEQSERHRPYVFHLYTVFREWILTPPRRKLVRSRGRVSYNWCVQTVSHGAFRFYAHQFYAGRQKVVPKLIHRLLTPRSLAYWFMDDGSIKSGQSKGIIFNTQAFSQADVDRLIKVLTMNFGLKAKRRKQRDGYQIYISGESFGEFCKLVEPYLRSEMRYKLPRARLTQLPKT